MKRELHERLERVGWDTLYEQYIQDLSQPNNQGERTALSPFPGSVETRPSFFVNPTKDGIWYDYHLGFGGDYVAFRALISGRSTRDQNNNLQQLIPGDLEYDETQRDLIVEFGVANFPASEYVGLSVNTLAHDMNLQQDLLRAKPWSLFTLSQFSIGFDSQRQRVVIPIYDRYGKLFNCRLYLPGGTPKFFWLVEHLTDNVLFPHIAYNEQLIILTEGEPDALTLRSYGLPGASSTAGAGNPVPSGNWFYNKHIYLWMDCDAAGTNAKNVAIDRLRNYVSELRVVNLPHWPGRPSNADVSDYIQNLYRQGLDREAITVNLRELLETSDVIELPNRIYQTEAIPSIFDDALSATNLKQHISWYARVAARSERVYFAPREVRLTCPTEGHSYCRRCPMHESFAGRHMLRTELRSSDLLKIIQSNEEEQLSTFKLIVNIPKHCPDVRAEILESADVVPVVLYPSLEEVQKTGNVSTELSSIQRREAYVLLEQENILREGLDYNFEGFVHPAPKTQQAVFIVDKYISIQSTINNFKLSTELKDQLKVFSPRKDQTVLDKLMDVAQDLSDSVTRIRDRMDLHLAYRCVWHSALAFQFNNDILQRGWLEGLIVGDTRCGKTQAFRNISKFLGVGLYIDCKNQTTAGLLGAVVTSVATGERYVTPGVLPLNDNGIACFDEFHAPKYGQSNIMEALSATRSEGVVNIAKAASARFRARVRSVWLGNPGIGKLVKNFGGEGVEFIPHLIKQPEDIARFDFAMIVAQDDVDQNIINSPHEKKEPRYPQELSRSLLQWVMSRTPEQVYFTPEAEIYLFDGVNWLVENYSEEIPIVEAADQRNRLAKLSVSVAAQCFSIDENDNLIVHTEHVYAALQLYQLWYNKTSMGYNKYSNKQRKNNTAIDFNEIERIISTYNIKDRNKFLFTLINHEAFNKQNFRIISNNNFGDTILAELFEQGCIRLKERGQSDFYECTPNFTKWIRQILAEEQ